MRPKKEKKDLRFEVRVKNNLILTKMEEAGIKSTAELARQVGLSYQTMHHLVSMTTSPMGEGMKWKSSVILLADFLKCLPSDLFSNEQQKQVLETNRTMVETSFTEMQQHYALMQAEESLPEEIVSSIEKSQCLKNALATLTPLQQKVLCLRFGLSGDDDMTFEEMGKTLDISGARAQQITQKALRRMREKPRAKFLKDFS